MLSPRAEQRAQSRHDSATRELNIQVQIDVPKIQTNRLQQKNSTFAANNREA
jgi:hypothetical protein